MKAKPIAVLLAAALWLAPTSVHAASGKASEKSAGAYVLPASYKQAYSYRTNMPHLETVALAKNKDLESIRISDTERYIYQVCDRISHMAANDFEKVKMAHDFLAALISYDIDNFWAGTVPAQDFASVIQTKKAVCEGYAKALKRFCDELKVPCEMVYGFSRGVGSSPFKEEDPTKPNHAWNIVRVNGEHYLVDCTWDAGHFENGELRRLYTTDWLFVKPKHMIYSHFPKNPDQQLLEKPISAQEFNARPDFRPKLFDSAKTEPIPSKIQACDGRYKMEFEVKKGYRLSFNLINLATKTTPQNRMFIRSIGSKTKVNFSLPTKDDYEVVIFCWRPGLDKGVSCGYFILKPSASSDVQYPTTYLTKATDACVLEPIYAPLKKGQKYKFTVHVADRKFVAVICGKNFIQLKNNGKGDFSGEIEIPQNMDVVSVGHSNAEMKSYEIMARYKVE